MQYLISLVSKWRIRLYTDTSMTKNQTFPLDFI